MAMTAWKRARPVIWRYIRKAAAVTWRALVKYDETDGEQRAASFAYYAFFALFPLIILLITIGTTFLGSQDLAAQKIIGQVRAYLPGVEENESNNVIRTITVVLKSRKSAGIIALAILAWSAMRFFQGLVHGVNRAWGTKEYSWWRLPIKNLLMVAILASALFIGIMAPPLLNYLEYLYWKNSWQFGLDFYFARSIFGFCRLLVPPLVLFYGFSMFYKYAPRRRTTFREVWIASLFVTGGLNLLQWLFVLYTKNIANFNAVYGTFGSVVAMLLWIYLSGSIIILGGCLSAAQYEINMQLGDQAESNRAD
jgi:Ca2+-transporting ATPase